MKHRNAIGRGTEKVNKTNNGICYIIKAHSEF